MSIIVRNNFGGGYSSNEYNSFLELNSFDGSNFVIIDDDGKSFNFNNFKLDMTYDNYWKIVLQDGDKELYRFDDNKLRDSKNNLIDIRNELEKKQDLLFNSKTYDDYGKTRAVQHFMLATDDLTMPYFDTHIFIDLNNVNNKNKETYEIDYTIIVNGKNFGNFKKDIKDDRFYEEREIESDILFDVLENTNKALESENIIIKTEYDFIPKDEAIVYLQIKDVQAGEWFKQSSYSAINYFAVNDGVINSDYLNSTNETKEKALAYHDGRMYSYNTPKLKELYSELEGKFTQNEIDEYYNNALNDILQDSNPFDEVKEMLERDGLSDRLIVVSRKGKDNFIFPQIIGYDDNCNIVNTILVETKPTKEEVARCIDILDSVKSDLFYQAKEIAYEQAIKYETEQKNVKNFNEIRQTNKCDDEPKNKRHKQ